MLKAKSFLYRVCIQGQCTPLYIASTTGFTEIVRSLIAANADVNCVCIVSCACTHIVHACVCACLCMPTSFVCVCVCTCMCVCICVCMPLLMYQSIA